MPSPGGTRGVAIDTRGFTSLARGFRAMDHELGLAFSASLREIGNEIRDKIRASQAPPFRTGRLRQSVKVSVRRGTISLYSTLPQAPVWEFGGTIEPRGAPIHIPETSFVSGEVKRSSEATAEKLAEVLDATARKYAGFHD